MLSVETPPRMWRKLRVDVDNLIQAGNTSTYVEKTLNEIEIERKVKKHLHVCGENCLIDSQGYCWRETPPRMWRKLRTLLSRSKAPGNTSTYVEKTRASFETWAYDSGNTSTYVEKTFCI